MQDKNITPSYNSEESSDNLSFLMNQHLFNNYRTGGLSAFCKKHDINYNSAAKIYRGSNEYPGVEGKIRDAMDKDNRESQTNG